MKFFFLNDKIILALISINAILIFLSGFSFPESTLSLFHLIDHIISALFVIEVIVKLREYGIRNYFWSAWNTMDFILIVLSLPALVTFLLGIEVGQLHFILALRVLRAFKSFRLLKFIPDIDALIMGVRRALKSSIIVVISFVIYLFTNSILSFYMFHHSAPDFFGNPMISLYSIFKVFTREGWNQIPETITSTFTPLQTLFTYGYFIFILLTGGIFGLSLVNSVFVDAMVSDNNDELERKIDDLNQKMNELLLLNQSKE